MLLQAAEDFHLDLARCWMVGDDERDIAAGKRAGCKTALIESGQADKKQDFGQDVTVSSLLEFTKTILRAETSSKGGFL